MLGGRRGFGVGVIGGARGVAVRRAGGQVPRAGHGGGRRRGAARWALRAGGTRAARHLLGHRLVSPELGLLAGGASGIKNPLVPGGSRGERAGTGLVSWLRAGQVRGSARASRVTPYCDRRSEWQPKAHLSHIPRRAGSFGSCLVGSSGASLAVLIRASTPGAAMGRATRKP